MRPNYFLTGFVLTLIAILTVPATGDASFAIIFIPTGIYMMVKCNEKNHERRAVKKHNERRKAA